MFLLRDFAVATLPKISLQLIEINFCLRFKLALNRYIGLTMLAVVAQPYREFEVFARSC